MGDDGGDSAGKSNFFKSVKFVRCANSSLSGRIGSSGLLGLLGLLSADSLGETSLVLETLT